MPELRQLVPIEISREDLKIFLKEIEMQMCENVNIEYNFPPGSVISSTVKHRVGNSEKGLELLVNIGRKGELPIGHLWVKVMLDDNGKAVVTVG